MSCQAHARQAVVISEKNGGVLESKLSQLSPANVLTSTPHFKPNQSFQATASLGQAQCFTRPEDALAYRYCYYGIMFANADRYSLLNLLTNPREEAEYFWLADGRLGNRNEHYIKPDILPAATKENYLQAYYQRQLAAEVQNDEDSLLAAKTEETKLFYEEELTRKKEAPAKHWAELGVPRYQNNGFNLCLYSAEEDARNSLLTQVPDQVTNEWLLACYQVLGEVVAWGSRQDEKVALTIKEDLDERILAKRPPLLQKQAQQLYQSNATMPIVQETPTQACQKLQEFLDQQGLKNGKDLADLLLNNLTTFEGFGYIWVKGKLVKLSDYAGEDYYKIKQADIALFYQNTEAQHYYFINGARGETPLRTIPDDVDPAWLDFCYQYLERVITRNSDKTAVNTISDELAQKKSFQVSQDVMKNLGLTPTPPLEIVEGRRTESLAIALQIRRQLEERFPQLLNVKNK